MTSDRNYRAVQIGRVAGLLFIALGLSVMSGCSRIHEPWDQTGFFKQYRTRSPELEKALQKRLLQGQVDRSTGIQQIDRI